MLRESAEMIPIEPDADNADAGRYDITEGYDTLVNIGQHPKDIRLQLGHRTTSSTYKGISHKEAPIPWQSPGLGAFSFLTAFTKSISVRFYRL